MLFDEKTKHRGEYEYIIIGGGTAGCVLADRLSASGQDRVLLLEAGREYRWYRHALNIFNLPNMARALWLYVTEPQRFLGGRAPECLPARVMGGGSSVNAMIYTRGDPQCYDDWASLGCTGWGYDEVLPHFRRFERYDGEHSKYHGTCGPMRISENPEKLPISRAFIEACINYGLPLNADFMAGNQFGVGDYLYTAWKGWRSTPAATYLRCARRRPNVDVLSERRALSINFKGERSTGVSWASNVGFGAAHCTKEVILCSGAIHTPQVLMLSGIGPKDHLAQLGIKVRYDSPDVGQNLQDHVRVPVIFKNRRPLPLDNPLFLLVQGIKYLFLRRGMVAKHFIDCGAFVRTVDEKGPPDCQLTFKSNANLDQMDCVDLEPCLVGTKSRGRVRLRSRSPFDSPSVDPNYLAEPDDAAVLVRGIQFARRVARTSPLYPDWLDEEVSPGSAMTDERDLDNYVRQHIETCFHPVGTCRMGGDKDSVVDPQLRVRGVEGLRIVDSSIMPKIMNGNTNGPTLMIAEKGADLILGKTAAEGES